MADLRLVSAEHSSSGSDVASIDTRLARLLRVLSSLAFVSEDGGSLNSHSLVVEFDEAYTEFVDGLENLPSESQMIALQAVDTKLSGMLRTEDAGLWTARARQDDPCWIEVRALVVDAMDEFSGSRDPGVQLHADVAPQG
jgi:hypothetical protein